MGNGEKRQRQQRRASAGVDEPGPVATTAERPDYRQEVVVADRVRDQEEDRQHLLSVEEEDQFQN